ncbi:phosphoribosylanthranilate isomerase [Oceanobacillus manasiensis]|uniref:phosphoribosylanthranilate isomerase n=1 Tax=Oceanobacillus manasiensis TaxID=586413 RepID=UPI000A80802A|nr:phosphoribosylanthranilate isomerase [Oceanobacillus manasiensis]
MDKFAEFIRITKKLNEMEIIPLLMGSVGLEVVTSADWDAQDLDIHVPGDERGWEVPPELSIHNWTRIAEIMSSIDYTLVDLHEHEFSNGQLSVEFGIMDTLPEFAGVPLEDLKMHQKDGANYFLLNPRQYLAVYGASSLDSYRADQNNNKDLKKIEFLKNMVENS